MKQPFIVGLWGASGVGKDSVADALRWQKAGFADPLREHMRPILAAQGLDIDKREDKEVARPQLVAEGKARRTEDPAYFIKRLTLPQCPAVVLKDIRYLNEIQWVLFNGGEVYELVRDGIEPANDEERRSFAEIRKFCSDLGVTIPVIRNTTPKAAAAAIRGELHDRIEDIEIALST